MAATKESELKFINESFDLYIDLAQKGVYANLSELNLAYEAKQNGEPVDIDEFDSTDDPKMRQSNVEYLKAIKAVALKATDSGYYVSEELPDIDDGYKALFMQAFYEGRPQSEIEDLKKSLAVSIIHGQHKFSELESMRNADESELDAAAPSEVTTLLKPLPVIIKQEPVDDPMKAAPTQLDKLAVFNDLNMKRSELGFDPYDKANEMAKMRTLKTKEELMMYHEQMTMENILGDRGSVAYTKIMDYAGEKGVVIAVDRRVLKGLIKTAELKNLDMNTVVEKGKIYVDGLAKPSPKPTVVPTPSPAPVLTPVTTAPLTQSEQQSIGVEKLAQQVKSTPAPIVATTTSELSVLEQQQIGIDKLSSHLQKEPKPRTTSATPASNSELAKAERKANTWWKAHPRGKTRDMNTASKKIVTMARDYIPSKNDFRGLDDGSRHMVKWSR